MVCFCTMMSGATAGGKSTTGAWNHLKASSFTGLPGSPQGPQLSSGPQYLHMFFPCGFSVWLSHRITPGFQAHILRESGGNAWDFSRFSFRSHRIAFLPYSISCFAVV